MLNINLDGKIAFDSEEIVNIIIGWVRSNYGILINKDDVIFEDSKVIIENLKTEHCIKLIKDGFLDAK